MSDTVCWILSKVPPNVDEIFSLTASILAEAVSIPDKILPAFCSEIAIKWLFKSSISCLFSSIADTMILRELFNPSESIPLKRSSMSLMLPFESDIAESIFPTFCAEISVKIFLKFIIFSEIFSNPDLNSAVNISEFWPAWRFFNSSLIWTEVFSAISLSIDLLSKFDCSISCLSFSKQPSNKLKLSFNSVRFSLNLPSMCAVNKSWFAPRFPMFARISIISFLIPVISDREFPNFRLFSCAKFSIEINPLSTFCWSSINLPSKICGKSEILFESSWNLEVKSAAAWRFDDVISDLKPSSVSPSSFIFVLITVK